IEPDDRTTTPGSGAELASQTGDDPGPTPSTARSVRTNTNTNTNTQVQLVRGLPDPRAHDADRRASPPRPSPRAGGEGAGQLLAVMRRSEFGGAVMGAWLAWLAVSALAAPKPELHLHLGKVPMKGRAICYPSGLEVHVVSRPGTGIVAVSAAIEGG